ncbi:MAG: RNA-binding S4 domain-containing protein [Lachnospiraceae bacterium]|nr:RNA-binding S4 domain-containing protein [Lachnospiraceae bacterium]
MMTIEIRDDFIKLGQLLKLSGFAQSGLEAKIFIHDGRVKLNDEVVFERGKKVVPGDKISFDGNEIRVEKKDDH